MPRLSLIVVVALMCLALSGLAVAPRLDGDSASGRAGPSGPRGELSPAPQGVPSADPEPAPPTAAQPVPPAPGAAAGVEQAEGDGIQWRRSSPLGRPFAGRLIHGVQLPAETVDFFTWDPIKKRSPNRPWRRWAADGTLRALLRVVAEFRVANPDAPRVAIGDLSRPRGGDFGPRYGKPGHASHQNGLDIDLYYPRRDRLERAPSRVGQVDQRLAQDLVNRFVRAGAVYVFVGPSTRLRGPRKRVEKLVHHDDHMHIRFPATVGR